jgi:hypothetical protein
LDRDRRDGRDEGERSKHNGREKAAPWARSEPVVLIEGESRAFVMLDDEETGVIGVW